LFDEYALFALDDFSLGNHSLSITGNSNVKVEGGMGVNGWIQGGNGEVMTDYFIQWNAAVVNQTKLGGIDAGEHFIKQEPFTFPSTMEVLKETFPSLKSVANAQIPGAARAIAHNTTRPRRWKSGLTSSSPLNASNTEPLNLSTGVAYELSTGDFWTGARVSPQTGATSVILPPGDYVFDEFSVTSGTHELLIDNAGLTVGGNTNKEPIRIWLLGSNTQDTIKCRIRFTDPNDASTFRIFVTKNTGQVNFDLARYPSFVGGIYAVADVGNCWLDLEGPVGYNNAIVNGFIYGGRLRIRGDFTVRRPVAGNSIYDIGGRVKYVGGYRELRG
jgi:hypothetical protein